MTSWTGRWEPPALAQPGLSLPRGPQNQCGASLHLGGPGGESQVCRPGPSQLPTGDMKSAGIERRLPWVSRCTPRWAAERERACDVPCQVLRDQLSTSVAGLNHAKLQHLGNFTSSAVESASPPYHASLPGTLHTEIRTLCPDPAHGDQAPPRPLHMGIRSLPLVFCSARPASARLLNVAAGPPPGSCCQLPLPPCPPQPPAPTTPCVRGPGQPVLAAPCGVPCKSHRPPSFCPGSGCLSSSGHKHFLPAPCRFLPHRSVRPLAAVACCVLCSCP